MILSLSYFKASQLSVKLLAIIELSRDRYSSKVSQYEIMSKQILKSAELHVFRIAVFNYLVLKFFHILFLYKVIHFCHG